MALTPNLLNGVSPYSQAASISNFASGTYVGDWTTGGDGAGVNPMTVFTGFTPRYVRLINATTGDQYEWFEGLAATKTLKTVAAGTATFDTNSVIVTNAAIVSATEVALQGAPGSQGPGEGVQGTVTITYDNPALNTPQLTFNSTAGASGAPVNANGTIYVWIAMG
jgi:hypothetical protein